MSARVASSGGGGGPGPPSSSSSQSQSSTSVSYETYAPRSTTQRDRLARIAELTAGPEAWTSRGKGGGVGDDGGSSKASAAVTASFLLRAMSAAPPKATPTEVPSPLDDDAAGDLPVAAGFDDDGADDGDVASPFLFHDDEGEGKSVEADNVGRGGDAETIRRSMAASGRTSSSLRTCIETGSALRDSLRAATDLAKDLSDRHADLVSRSGELSTACERLRNEEAVLSRHAEDIGAPLKHYDAVDSIGVRVGVLFKERGRVVVRGLARVNVDSDEYVEVLDEIDEALAFFLEAQERQRLQQQQGHHGMVPGQGSSFPMAAEGPEYCRRAMALHEAATYLIKEAVVDRINQATTDIMAALNMPKRILPADKLEASLIYTRFHGISSRSNSLITILQKRVDRPGGYRELLDLCQNMYCSSREQLLKATVRAHMDTLRDQHGLVGMTRLASLFLMRLCSVETALYLDFFGMPPAPANADAKEEEKEGGDGEGSAAKAGGGDDSAAGKSTSAAGHHGAPRSKNEPSPSLDDEPFQKMLGSLCSNLHRTVRRGVVLLSDLDLLCQVVGVLREERAAANASPATRATARAISGVIEDAQERLIFCTQVVLQKEVIRFKPTAADLDYPAKLLAIKSGDGGGDGGGGGGGGEDAVQAQMKVYEAWFPPMRSVLRVLSKIFRVVEPRVFEDIALQAVQACTKSLKDAAAYISSKQGVVHADLFLVKHLLILREQLSPFDIQLRAVERQLDFSEAGKAVTKFLANRNRRIFSMSNENALVTLLREGVSVQESSVDSKRDLEDALRSACNDFIEHTSLKLAGPLLEFVEQCKFASSSSSVVLKTQSFMNGETVKCIFVDTNKALATELDTLKSHMAVYLESSATQGILLKPVARKITRSLDDAKRFISEMEDEENGWDSSLKVEVLALAKDIEQAVKEASSKTASR